MPAHISDRVSAILLASLLWASPATAQYGAKEGEWRFYGGDAGSTKYSALGQIDRNNVNDLQIAWRWRAENFGPRPEFYYRATPLMIDGVLYTTAGFRRAAVAIDAATGETLWVYRMDEGERGLNAPRDNSGRGVAYWTDGSDERIFLITPGYHLVALDAKTGIPRPDFGNQGVVDLKKGLGREVDPIKGGIELTTHRLPRCRRCRRGPVPWNGSAYERECPRPHSGLQSPDGPATLAFPHHPSVGRVR